MKSPKKPIKKAAIKGKSQDDASKKTKLKPVNPKENKNWKNKLDEELEPDLELLDPMGDPEELG